MEDDGKRCEGDECNDELMYDVRILEARNGFFDTLGSQSKCTIRELGRTRHALELGDLLRLLSVHEALALFKHS